MIVINDYNVHAVELIHTPNVTVYMQHYYDFCKISHLHEHLILLLTEVVIISHSTE